MQKYYTKKLLLLYSLLFFLGVLAMYVWHSTSHIAVKAAEESKAEAVVEVTTGRVLYTNNAQTPLPMASTTKILTAIIIIEDCNLKEVITVHKNTVGVEGSSVYLKENDKLTVEDLLYGLMLRSGNDCAETLATHHSGCNKKFADVMNVRAKAMGAANSNFQNPHGLPAENHFTTAEDLAKIAAYAMQNAVFQKMVATKQYLTSVQEGTERRLFVNKNKLLYNYKFANGIKTGFTKEAGRCLVSAANKNGMQLVAVVINSLNMYERSEALLENAFAGYSMQNIFDCNDLPQTISTDSKNKSCAIGLTNKLYYPLSQQEQGLILRKINLPQVVKLPIRKGVVVGRYELYLKDRLLASTEIVAMQDIQKSYFDVLKDIIKR